MSSIFESPARPVDYQNQQPRRPDGTIVELSPEEMAIQQDVFEKYRAAKKYRKAFDKDWDRWYKLYAGQHWDQTRPDWKSTPVVNFIFSTIETIIPIMTDSSPQLVVAPAEPSCAETAEVMGDIVKRIWVSNDMDLKLPVIVKNLLKYGTGFAKVWWKENDDPEIPGDVELSVVDPRHIFPAPGAIEIEDADHLIFAANVPINYVERMYPEAVGRLVGGIWEEDLTVQKTITSQTGGYGTAVIGPVQSSANITDGSGSNSSTSWAGSEQNGKAMHDRSKLATLLELWHRKDGRAWLTVCANGIVLRHAESPFKHNKFPFVKFSDYVVPSCFWAMGEIQQLERLQDFINKRRGQTQDILRICGNPPLVADSNSGINPKAMTTRPGTIIYKNPGTQVNWLTPPQLPNALFEVQALDKQDFDAVSGIYDVTQGRKPKGIEAASAINELQDAAQTRLRLKVRNLEGSLRKLGQLMVSLVQQYYTEERVIRLVGGNPNQPDFRIVNQEIIDNMGNSVRINDVTVGRYDIEIGVGSTMPINKSRLFQEVTQLYQLQIVSGKTVLENSSLSPSAQAKALQDMQAQQQQMMQQQGMGAPPAGGSQQGAPNQPQGEDPVQMSHELHSMTQEG
jgi:hypothetical protein